ncbi:hypothetical protein B0T10DRAFT_477052 [Thelonectria olida]|uniref:Uncharacterized protein n=1 Tax=Thelonectria olida TaxID=1576542 RepID=A0A9P8WBZ3_9HYPO|nr:hypothetical protein B0T10DRAFT_477052 [Thelonectria olida]
MDDKNKEAKSPNNGKGKGKENDSSSGNISSITERLQASGRLALNAVTGGPDLATQQTGEKGTATFGSVDKSFSIVGEASSTRLASSGSSALGQSIRTQPVLDSSLATEAFNDFTRAEPSLHFEHHQQLHQQPHHPSSSVTEQEKADGAAVVSLLDGPSNELDAVLLGAHDDLENDDGLDPATVNKLRDALFNSSHLESRWDDMLNFTPAFLGRPGASAEDTLLHLGTSDPEEARRIWLHQWSDVLSSYTDQVWGDLGPLAEDARKEVEELTSNEAIPDRPAQTKALDRLRQILAHVRGH